MKNEDHGDWCHHFVANRWGNNGNSDRLYLWAPKSLQMVTAAMKLKLLGNKLTVKGIQKKKKAPWKKSCDQPRQHNKKQTDYFADKGLSSQSYGFPSSHEWL